MSIHRYSGYVQEPERGPTTVALAVVVRMSGPVPDRIDLWRLEEAVAERLRGVLGDEGALVSVGIAAAGPQGREAPEWLLERACEVAVAGDERAG